MYFNRVVFHDQAIYHRLGAQQSAKLLILERTCQINYDKGMQKWVLRVYFYTGKTHASGVF